MKPRHHVPEMYWISTHRSIHSGEIESCTATSRINFGPDITVNSGAMVSLTSPEVAILSANLYR